MKMHLRKQILSGVDMIDEARASELLGLPAANPAQVMRSKGPVFCFQIEGRRFYPGFQFDPENHRIHPWFVQILRAARAAGWSEFRILNWMMRPHLDFDETPATSLADNGEEVLLAFLQEIVPEDHR